MVLGADDQYNKSEANSVLQKFGRRKECVGANRPDKRLFDWKLAGVAN